MKIRVYRVQWWNPCLCQWCTGAWGSRSLRSAYKVYRFMSKEGLRVRLVSERVRCEKE